MRTAMYESTMFQSLPAMDVVRYLRSRAWTEQSQQGDIASIWEKTLPSGSRVELLLPMQTSFGDYALRMAELFQSLAKVEQRSLYQILSDIRSASSDIIRVRLHAGNTTHHTLPIEDAVLAVTKARDMMLAAACSAVEPREHYQARKFSQATEYVRKLQLGQTEPGSFVFTLLSQVPPTLSLQKTLPQVEEIVEVPFERQVTTMLMSGLHAAKHAAQRAVASDSLEPFQQAKNLGVSANLCDALVGLAGTDKNNPFEVSLSWSANRTAPPDATHSRVSFEQDLLPIFEQASHVIKEASPRDEFELEGMIVRMDNEDTPGSRAVRIMGLVDGKMPKVEVVLTESDFELAHQAFRERQSVRIFGELVRVGKRFVLNNPRRFELLPSED